MDTQSIEQEFKSQSQHSITQLSDEIRQIRTGKASPSLVEDLDVMTYGGQMKMKLKELASISTEGPTTILIDPFDPSTIQDIEKAFLTSPLQLSPRVEGKMIRLITPPLSTEQREKFVKLVNQKVEETKNNIRYHRDHARKGLKTLLDDKAITEDEKFRFEKTIDTLTKDFSDDLEVLKKKKHDEIMSI
ncbi:ribosome recycling factor [Candidatus Woesebacteria bacterium]|nr:ribosome recycling factor [Candidatus Woesebacteria bacterium]